MDLAELTLELCSAAGPAGFEESVSRLIAEKIAPFVDEVKSDVMGNLIAVKRCGMENAPDVSDFLLGDAQFVQVGENKTVVNMFGQQYYGYDGKRYTSYDGFWSCLGKILESVPKGSKIGFPDHIGCGLGGANWEVIRTMIEQALGNDFDVYIYKLEV